MRGDQTPLIFPRNKCCDNRQTVTIMVVVKSKQYSRLLSPELDASASNSVTTRSSSSTSCLGASGRSRKSSRAPGFHSTRARLREVRLSRRMTQERFAEMLDVSVDFLNLMERGRNAPSCEPWTGLPID